MASASPRVRSANEWTSNHALESVPAKTVVGLEAPMGKINFVFGNSSGRVFGVPLVAGVRLGMGKERRGAANDGPFWDVPWRVIMVWVCSEVGVMMYGSG